MTTSTEPVAEVAPEAPTEVAIDDLADDLETFRLAKAEIEKWKAVQDAAKEKIVARVGESEVATIGGRTAIKLPHREVWRVNTTKLRADLTDDVLKAQGYLRPSTERRFEVTD